MMPLCTTAISPSQESCGWEFDRRERRGWPNGCDRSPQSRAVPRLLGFITEYLEPAFAFATFSHSGFGCKPRRSHSRGIPIWISRPEEWGRLADTRHNQQFHTYMVTSRKQIEPAAGAAAGMCIIQLFGCKNQLLSEFFYTAWEKPVPQRVWSKKQRFVPVARRKNRLTARW